MKLVIDISEEAYKEACGSYLSLKSKEEMRIAIKNGTPLDEVKALIEYNAEIHEDGECYLMEQWVYDILDGKYQVERSKGDDE